jgi:two-component system OmpR family sensor kinase
MKRLSLRRLFSLLYLGSVLPLLLRLGGLVYYEYRTFLIYEHTVTMQKLVQATVLPRAVDNTEAIDLSLPRLGSLLAEQLQGTDFAAVVLNADRQPLTQSEESASWLSAAQQAASVVNASTQTVATDDGRRVLYTLPVRNPDGNRIGTIIASFPVAVVQTELYPLSIWLLLTVGGVALLALLATPLLARLAIRPLAGLIHTAQQVARGDLTTRSPLPPVIELQTLASTLNTMLDQVQHTVALEQQTATALRRFVADAAHELRSPLAVLRGSVDVWHLAQQHGDQAEAQQSAKLVQAEIDVMGRLVDDLLLLARMDNAAEQSRLPLNCNDVEPLPLLEEVAERARMLAKGQDVVLEWPDGDVPSIPADADLLRRALNNLLENALRHTPAGKRIILSVAPERGGSAFVVQDEGSGIAPEHLPPLFERFYQVDDAHTRQCGSSGLGLAIVWAIVQSHGGEVYVSSTLGHGATFKLWLPGQEALLHVRRSALPELLARQTTHPREAPRRPRPLPERRGRLAGVWLMLSVMLLALLVLGGWHLLPQDASLSVDQPFMVTVSTHTPTPLPTAMHHAPAPVAPPPLITGLGFDAAAQQAIQHLGAGTPLEVSYEPEDGGAVYEVVLNNYTRVLLDLESGTMLKTEPDRRGNGRGVIQQRVEAARVASIVAQGGVVMSFDQAAAAAQAAAPEYGDPYEVELEWEEDWDRIVYSVAFTDELELLIDPQTGEVIEW